MALNRHISQTHTFWTTECTHMDRRLTFSVADVTCPPVSPAKVLSVFDEQMLIKTGEINTGTADNQGRKITVQM